MTQYTLQIWDQQTSSWGSDIILATNEFTIPMATLEQDYSYTQCDLITLRVKSENQFGNSDWSTNILTQEGLRVEPL